MKTYQDLMALTSETDRQSFIKTLINEHKASALYKEAAVGYEYYRKRNVTITQFQKLLYTLSGETVPDTISANFKFANSFFPIFVKQEVSHLLGNGVTFEEDVTKDSLGGPQFDNQLFRAAIAALWGGVSFMFFNLDHVDVFKVTEFAPLYDEENGALRAGARFWQIDSKKPMRVTFYEEDGFTEYKYDGGTATILQPKRAYMMSIKTSEATGLEIYEGKNYPAFPIVPLWANEEKQNELIGIREKIDGYDLIQSGFANDLDEASHIYWIITNSGGMDDIDLKKFIERMKTVHAATVDDGDGSTATPHTIEVPYAARQAGLTELRDSLYRDAMALDTDKISAGNVTATAIEASYENLTLKTDAFEMCVTDAIKALLDLAGIDDNPTYKRSKIINMQEDTQMVLSAAQYLDDETILKHLPFLNPDEIDDIIARKDKEEAERYGNDFDTDGDNQGTEEEGSPEGSNLKAGADNRGTES